MVSCMGAGNWAFSGVGGGDTAGEVGSGGSSGGSSDEKLSR
jgi:hypothetical protein